MSPEQALASNVAIDHRTDVYSLGVTLYEALSGRRPFEGESVLEVLDAIRGTAPPALVGQDRRGTADAAAVVRRAMARRPEDRYASMRDLEADLLCLAQRRGTRARSEEGGPLRRALAHLALASSGHPYEYRSARTLLGLPLVHVNVGARGPDGRVRRAKGWFALGQVATGGTAVGHAAFGVLTTGSGLSAGMLSIGGGLSVGLLLAFAGALALGGFATAGVAGGFFAIGGMAWGFAAIGGRARGHYAAGGDVEGEFVLSPHGNDPEAEAFFGRWMPWIVEAFQR